MDSTKFDDILMGILQHCEQVEPFLDAIFSFLARRTDFFRVMQNREDKMGFPPGVAEKIVLKIFRAYQEMVLGTSVSLEAAKKTAPGKKPKKAKKDVPSTATLPELAQDAPVKSSQSAATKEEQETEPPPVASSVDIETSPAKELETSSAQSISATEGATTAPIQATALQPPQQAEGSKDAENQGITPGTSDECYNGAVLDNYTWSQTIKDIDVRIPVSSSITKARDVGVEIKSSHLKVWIKKGGDDNFIIDGKLQRTIKCEESLWSLEPRKCILINLEKTEERFWTAVLEGDAEIDKTKVDTTRDISDFDEQTQSDFQRVMYDHHQKLQGKPTSQEAKTHELLKQAWNAKGSPFAGTEFDPSRVNISPSYG